MEQRRHYVGIDLHRRRSVIVRRSAEGDTLSTVRIDNDPLALAGEVAKAGEAPEVVLELFDALCRGSGIAAFATLAKTLREWRIEIVNYAVSGGKSNAFAEAIILWSGWEGVVDVTDEASELRRGRVIWSSVADVCSADPLLSSRLFLSPSRSDPPGDMSTTQPVGLLLLRLFAQPLQISLIHLIKNQKRQAHGYRSWAGFRGQILWAFGEAVDPETGEIVPLRLLPRGEGGRGQAAVATTSA